MNSGRRSTIALLLWIATQAGYAQAPPPPPAAPITMQQAVDMALAHNPELLSAQQNLLSMKGQEVEAGLRQNPDLALSGENVSIPTTNPAGPYFYSASVSRLFERGQKRRWRLDSARATTAQTEAQYHDQITTDDAPGEAKLHQSSTGQSDFETGAG